MRTYARPMTTAVQPPSRYMPFLGLAFTIKTFLAVGLLSVYTALLPALVSLESLNRGFAAVMGGFLFGYDSAVINGAVSSIQDDFGIGNTALGFAVASARAKSRTWPSQSWVSRSSGRARSRSSQPTTASSRAPLLGKYR